MILLLARPCGTTLSVNWLTRATASATGAWADDIDCSYAGPGGSVVTLVFLGTERFLGRRGTHATPTPPRTKQMRWGLVPGWAKSPLGGTHPINARAETVARSPLFRHAFRVTRCLVPADGFYEWQRLPDGTRQPHYITTPDGSPLAFAGLWSAWSERTSEAPALLTCAILTTTPNETMATIHDRMPVILTPDTRGLWLGRESDPSELQGLLRPYPGDLLLYPVAPLVNSVRQQGPALIAPLLPE